MKEIRIEADRIKLFDEKGKKITVHEGNKMCLGDFTVNDTAIALALYRTILELEENEVKIIDEDFDV